MEFFKIRRDIPFMRHALIFNIISLATFLAAVFFLWQRGLHFSIEFTGGTVMEVSYDQPADVDRIRATLERAGFADPQVQNFGSSRDVLIRLPLKTGQSSADLSKQTAGVECRKDNGVLDEIPGAYKSIEAVMKNQKDLVEMVDEIKQVVCVKG